MPYESFEVCFNDHLAGVTAGVNVAQECAERNRCTEPGVFYAEIASEIKADFDAFEGLMGRLSVGRSAGKAALAVAATA